MVKKFNITQITEIFIRSSSEEGSKEISIRYVDDSSAPYKQQNFRVWEGSGINDLNDILKPFGLFNNFTKNSFVMNKETNMLELTDYALQKMKKESGFDSILKVDGQGDGDSLLETSVQGLYRIKGKDDFYKMTEKGPKKMFLTRRKGSVVLKGEVADRTFNGLLTFEDKDIVKYFLNNKEVGEYEIIPYDENVLDFNLEKIKEVDMDGNLKNQ